jgi:1-phosphofructokinase
MIVTVTPNPSIDRTITLDGPLTRGAVHRAASATHEPGGKGVNVARALTLADVHALAILPAAAGDPLVAELESRGLPFRSVPVRTSVRTNLAVTEHDGTTTKFNERGAVLEPSDLDALTQAVEDFAGHAEWAVLSGSLPPGVPDAWYADLVHGLRRLDCQIAVDTSDGPLVALAAAFDRAAPDLLKPNSEELASITGTSAVELELAVAQGDPEPVVAAARKLVERGVRTVLATLGAAGAVLVNEDGSWLAIAPPIAARSTVGAGDSSLAGYLRADVSGATSPERLRMAVAYGTAAASLPGSEVPSPEQVDIDVVQIHPISHQPIN